MINKQQLFDKQITNNLQGVFDITSLQEITLDGFSLTKRDDGYVQLKNASGQILAVDAPDYITEFCSELIDIEFNSILVGGLGLGVVPFVCQSFASVDVIENEEKIINLTSQLNHLNSNVNVIYGDIFTYGPTKTYDIVVMDIWYNSIPENEITDIVSKYLPFVNEGGFLYFPLNKIDKPDKIKYYKS